MGKLPSIVEIKADFKEAFIQMHPWQLLLEGGHYTLDDIIDQFIFEVIIEEYKKYAERHTIQYYLKMYDDEYVGSTRKYTRSIQYAQHFRNFDNDHIQKNHGFRLQDLEKQDVSGSKTFEGYQFTEQEFLQYKLKADCSLLGKLHGRQIENSKKVSESAFKELFSEYYTLLSKLEPPVNNAELVISRTVAYYATETYFLVEFLYNVTLAAEKAGFPKDIPVDRILEVCALQPKLPAIGYCPAVNYAALLFMPKWSVYANDFFTDNDEDWLKKDCVLLDSMQKKTFILQSWHDKLVEYMHSCNIEEKASFIIERYWIWDNLTEFEWTPDRIRYYRKLHAAIMRDFPKPHIN